MSSGYLSGTTLLLCAELTALCHNPDLIPSEALIDAGMRAIFKGVLALEAELDKLAELGVHVRSFSGHYPTLMIQISCKLHLVLGEPQGRLALNVVLDKAR